ncbi:MAG: hypothetical protein HY077_04325 [Elusimicrobia bacterium]|nr:hypothetical protein [Elusimicrobiota bacterium]
MRKKVLGVVAAAVLLAAVGARAEELTGLEKTLQADQGSGTAWGGLYDGGESGEPGAAPAVSADAAAGGTGASLISASAGSSRGETAVPPPAFASGAGAQGETGVWAGTKKGASEGALLGFYAVLSPAVKLLSEGFGRAMSRGYDGPRSDNGSAKGYEAAGIALAVVLYIPALVVGAVAGAVGAAAGAVSEAVEPGSTKDWDTEKRIFG